MIDISDFHHSYVRIFRISVSVGRSMSTSRSWTNPLVQSEWNLAAKEAASKSSLDPMTRFWTMAKRRLEKMPQIQLQQKKTSFKVFSVTYQHVSHHTLFRLWNHTIKDFIQLR